MPNGRIPENDEEIQATYEEIQRRLRARQQEEQTRSYSGQLYPNNEQPLTYSVGDTISETTVESLDIEMEVDHTPPPPQPAVNEATRNLWNRLSESRTEGFRPGERVVYTGTSRMPPNWSNEYLTPPFYRQESNTMPTERLQQSTPSKKVTEFWLESEPLGKKLNPNTLDNTLAVITEYTNIGKSWQELFAKNPSNRHVFGFSFFKQLIKNINNNLNEVEITYTVKLTPIKKPDEPKGYRIVPSWHSAVRESLRTPVPFSKDYPEWNHLRNPEVIWYDVTGGRCDRWNGAHPSPSTCMVFTDYLRFLDQYNSVPEEKRKAKTETRTEKISVINALKAVVDYVNYKRNLDELAFISDIIKQLRKIPGFENSGKHGTLSNCIQQITRWDDSNVRRKEWLGILYSILDGYGIKREKYRKYLSRGYTFGGTPALLRYLAGLSKIKHGIDMSLGAENSPFVLTDSVGLAWIGIGGAIIQCQNSGSVPAVWKDQGIVYTCKCCEYTFHNMYNYGNLFTPNRANRFFLENFLNVNKVKERRAERQQAYKEREDAARGGKETIFKFPLAKPKSPFLDKMYTTLLEYSMKKLQGKHNTARPSRPDRRGALSGGYVNFDEFSPDYKVNHTLEDTFYLHHLVNVPLEIYQPLYLQERTFDYNNIYENTIRVCKNCSVKYLNWLDSWYTRIATSPSPLLMLEYTTYLKEQEKELGLSKTDEIKLPTSPVEYAFTEQPGGSSSNVIRNYSDNPLKYYSGFQLGSGEIRRMEKKTKWSKTGKSYTEAMKDTTLYMGVELEVTPGISVLKFLTEVLRARGSNTLYYETQYLAARLTQVFEQEKKSFIIKSDSTTGNGFEIVSVPGTHKWHLEEGWKGFFKEDYEDQEEAKLYAPSSFLCGWLNNGQAAGKNPLYGRQGTRPLCGIHIHVSKDALTPLQLGKMLFFINDEHNKKFIDHVAGRGENSYNGKQAKKIKDGRGIDVSLPESRGSRFQALNIHTGKPTVEFRIFRSNVSRAGFFKNIDFAHAVTTWCGSAASSDTKQLTFENFVAWVNTQRGVYKYLTKWLTDQKYLNNIHVFNPKYSKEYEVEDNENDVKIRSFNLDEGLAADQEYRYSLA